MLAVLKTRPLMVLPLWLMSIGTSASPADAPLNRIAASRAPSREVGAPTTSRFLTRRAVFQAIQDHLEHLGIARRGDLRPEDLRIQSSVPIIKSEAGLEVKKISFDPLRRMTVFELWTSGQPEYLPFAVTARRDLRSWGINQLPAVNTGEEGDETRNPNHGPRSGGPDRKLPVLAKPGHPATLVMIGENMRITTTVVPLQPGTKGQCILVRDAATARVMKAEVVDDGLLQCAL